MVMNQNEIKNTELIDAIDRFSKFPSKGTESEFINAIKNGKYLTPIKFEGEICNNVIQKNSEMSFLRISNKNGEQFFPLFTDMEELKKWNPDHNQTLVLTFIDAASLVDPKLKKGGLVINPMSTNIILTPEKIDYVNNYK